MMENSLRENVDNRILSSDKQHIVIEIGTGFGKSLLALHKLNQIYFSGMRVLIVVPRLVLMQNWIDEFEKWDYADMLSCVSFSTYVSFPKMTGQWDLVIYDEAHHLSERCQNALPNFQIKRALYLSATLKDNLKYFLYNFYGFENIDIISVSTKKAIEAEVLPTPKILLVPLRLDNTVDKYLYVAKKAKSKSEKPLVIPIKDKWKYKNYKNALTYRCTQRQYYDELSSLIDWYKRNSYNPFMKNMWLHKCGERLQWLSGVKFSITSAIISQLKCRYIVFCNTIEESEKFGIPTVNSKTGIENLELFNKKKIKCLAAVNCLNEGINLSNCKVGVFNAINSSDTMQIQKIGRVLRHKHPVIIIPYYKDTREEEIVTKWMENFDENNVIIINNINEIKLYAK